MKLSIWSAFSSNHSSRFTVVGVFGSPEHAEQAAEILTSLLRPIADWYNQPENAAAREEWLNAGRDPSPPEQSIVASLGIPWSPLSLDWLWFDDDGNSPVKVFNL